MNNKNSKVKNHSICQLEGWDWKGETITVEDDGMIAFRFYKLTQKPLTDLSPADIDFMIIQKRGLPYLVPMALDILEEDFFIEADDYNGDLVLNLLRLSDYNNDEYWSNHPVEKARFCEMYKSNQQNMEEDLGYFWDVIKEIKSRFTKFCEQSDKKMTK